jgi:hypothetical protein
MTTRTHALPTEISTSQLQVMHYHANSQIWKKYTNNGPSHLKSWDTQGSECKDYCLLEYN